MTITWPKCWQVVFHGRNGTGYCCGLELHHLRPTAEDGGVVDLVPLTSRGQSGNCSISIPMARLTDVIAALSSIHKTVPTKRR